MLQKAMFLFAVLLLVLPIVSADVIMPPEPLLGTDFTVVVGEDKYTIVNAADYSEYDFYSSLYGGSTPDPRYAPPSAGAIYISAVPKGTPEEQVIRVDVRGIIPLKEGHTFWEITSFDVENSTMGLEQVELHPEQPFGLSNDVLLLLAVVVAFAVVLFAVKYLRK